MRRAWVWLWLVLFLVPVVAGAQVQRVPADGTASGVDDNADPTGAVTAMPASPINGERFVVTDGAHPGDCAAGGGAEQVTCQWDASEGTWRAISATDLQRAYEIGAYGGWTNVPNTRKLLWQPELAGSGPKQERWGEGGQLADVCTASDGTPCQPDPIYIPFNRRHDILVETDDDPLTSKTIGEIENVAGTTTIRWKDVDGTTQLEWSSAAGNRVSVRGGQVYFPARALEFDGTHCAEPTTGILNSGPKAAYFLCADNDAGVFHGHFPTVNTSYRGEPLTFTFVANHGTTETITCEFDVVAQGVAAGDAVTNTWSSSSPASLSITTANDEVRASTGAITPAGTAAQNATIYFKATRDATASGANCANTKHLGVQMRW